MRRWRVERPLGAYFIRISRFPVALRRMILVVRITRPEKERAVTFERIFNAARISGRVFTTQANWCRRHWKKSNEGSESKGANVAA